MKTPACFSAILAIFLLFGFGGAQAEALNDPYASSNRNPFVQVYGLPVAESAQLTSEGKLSTGLQLELVNNFSEDSKGNESIFIDGETFRANIQLRYGLSESFELGLDIPYLSHDGGSLDGFIDDWHDFWGLPDGDRPDFPQDQLRYVYQRDGEVLANVTRSAGGLGDISLNLAYQLPSSELRQWALRTAIKLPTGDADDLLGSGSTDISFGIGLTDQSLLQNYNLTWHASSGLLWMGSGEVLDELREDWVVYGSSTLSWMVSESLSLKLQLDAHSTFYDSALTELGSHSAQLMIGGAIRLGERWVLDLAVSEDVAVDTAPDVVFYVSIKAVEW
jgi:hypothetical protein